MLTKSQKVASCIIGVLALIIGIVSAIPFRTLTSNADILTIEYIVKFIVFPIIVLISMAYPLVIKYKQLKEGVERSRTANWLSFLPAVVYILGVLLFALHTLTFKLHPMTDVAHNILIVITVAYIVAVVVAIPVVEKVEMRLPKKGTYILDICIEVLVVIFALISFRVAKTYAVNYASYDSGFLYGAKNYDPYLFVLYVLLFFVAVYFLTKLFKLVKADETVVYAVKLTDEEVDQLILEEYDNAYNDILDEFEDYFDKELEAEAAEEEGSEEEPCEEAPEEEPVEEGEAVAVAPVEEEAPAEEPAEEEAPTEEPVEEETPAEEEAPAEEQEENKEEGGAK